MISVLLGLFVKSCRIFSGFEFWVFFLCIFFGLIFILKIYFGINFIIEMEEIFYFKRKLKGLFIVYLFDFKSFNS